ncbi:hypothetical protein DFR58_1209 [Anaerobacterium chartisolvens]|uniref:Butirosin biosynthesis protein H-like n=2 Tax=Anaerobacterium chartisolvens TaxID=1297424 RepID=A0A369ATL4_9FIRM|nr:hypothetical protein DFR58_1209 [Anaerobacterium chartisolvens]
MGREPFGLVKPGDNDLQAHERPKFMNSKILYTHDPIVNTYTTYGILFSIMHDRMWPWIFNNFIQIRYAPAWGMYVFDNHRLLLSDCPYIAYYCFPQSLIISKWNKSLKQLIIDSVNSDFYLFLFADRYYIPKSDCYLKEHNPHEIFIFGYDLEKEIVYAADNLEYGKFIQIKCTFQELENGYWSVKGKYTLLTDVRLLKPKDDITCDFDLEQVLLSLDSYLNSKRTVDVSEDQKCDFGFDSFRRIFEDLSNLSAGEDYIDIRPFHLFYEHKLLMDMRVKYLVQNGYLPGGISLTESFSTLKDDYLSLRNLIVKYDVKKDPKLVSRITNKFQQNIMVEKSLIANLIQAIIQSG